MIPHTVTGELAVDVSSPLMTFYICFSSLDQGGGGRLERLVQKRRTSNVEAVDFDGDLFDLGDKKFVLVGGDVVYGCL